MSDQSSTLLGLLKDSHRAAVLKKWVGGQKLSLEEMGEVSDLIPPAQLANPPLPRPGYRRAYDHYARELGYDLRSIKRLVALGKRARNLCPLDDFAQLASWWEQMKAAGHLKQSVPSRLEEASAKARAAAAPPLAVAAAATTTPGADRPGETEENLPPGQNSSSGTGTKINVDQLKAFGLAEAVKELTLQLAADQQELRLARSNGLDEITVSRRQKAFNATLDSLRKAEESLQKLREARGDLVALADVRGDLTTVFTTLRGMMRRRADNICTALAALLAPEQLAALRTALLKEEDRELVQLRSAKLWQRTPDGHVIA